MSENANQDKSKKIRFNLKPAVHESKKIEMDINHCERMKVLLEKNGLSAQPKQEEKKRVPIDP